MEVGDNSSATEEPSDLDEEKTPATEAAPKRVSFNSFFLFFHFCFLHHQYKNYYIGVFPLNLPLLVIAFQVAWL